MGLDKLKRLFKISATAVGFVLSCIVLLGMSTRRRQDRITEERRCRSALAKAVDQLAADLEKLNNGWGIFFEAHGPLAARAQASKERSLAHIADRVDSLKQRLSDTAEPAGRFAPLMAKGSLPVLSDLQGQADALAEALLRQAEDLHRMQLLTKRQSSYRPTDDP
jgi:hypothetical protein